MPPRCTHLLRPLLGVLMLGVTLPCFAENWPCFRGPTGQGVSSERNLPLTWGLQENLAWRVDIPGVGWSSPVVWGDRVFLTSASADGTSYHVLCIDRDRGRFEFSAQGLQCVCHLWSHVAVVGEEPSVEPFEGRSWPLRDVVCVRDTRACPFFGHRVWRSEGSRTSERTSSGGK